MSTIKLAPVAIEAILNDIREHGRVGHEAGAMLLTVDDYGIVAVLGERGIERHGDHLVVSGLALATLFDWADERGATVVAQLHSHGSTAFMSDTDRRFGLTVEGFTSAIVPEFACPPSDPSAWGWWRFTGGIWLPIEPAMNEPGTTEVVIFDEDGVRAG